jgi:GT2 family glycosyltransferase
MSGVGGRRDGMARVAVNVLTYNSAGQIDACLDCLARQDYPAIELQVIDNGSRDDTLDRLAPWAARGVRVVAHPDNRYYARAHNEAIAAGDAPFVVTVNPDVLLAPAFISRVMAVFAREPRVGSVNGKLLLLEEARFDPAVLAADLDPSALIDSAGLTIFRSRRPYLRGYRRPARDHCLTPCAIFGADGACAAYRRAMLEDIALDTPEGREYFDNDFVMYREDVDLAWRAQLFGWDSYYEPAAPGYHVRGFHIGRDRGKMAPLLRRHSVKNGWALLVKNDEARALLRDLAFVLPYQAKILAGLFAIERSSLGAAGDLARLLPRLRAKRAQILARRRRTMRELSRWFV